jgi:hypothetical protein
MIGVCDGCGQFVMDTVTILNAKEWNADLCHVSQENSSQCHLITCHYNLERECCIEFQFCATCLSQPSIVNKIFEAYRK